MKDKTILRPPSPEPEPEPEPAPSATAGAVTNGAESAKSPEGENKVSEKNPGPSEKDVAADTGTMPDPGKRSLEKT